VSGVADPIPAPAAGAEVAPAQRPASPRPLWRRLLDRYPELPPMPEGPLARACTIAVAALAVAFVAFFCAYMFARHDAYLTHAEDLGIMDQALWNTLHGAPLHQTICNNVSDSNCLGDISRLAIHFEPIMFPLSLLYLVAASPKTLFVVQSVVVAAGAFPAYWIAARRLRSPLAGVAFAAIFLLYPALDAAVTYDFHAVTLSAAFLMFALYFMLTRNNVGLFVACLLALSTKEQMPLDVIMIGLSVLALQRRWRVGLGLIALSIAWLGLYVVVTHFASPLGHTPLADRYAYLGKGPLQVVVTLLTHPGDILRDHVFDPDGRNYLRVLLSPTAYLALLSPLTLLIAVPALLLNLLSTYSSMRTGIYQYNAEIVPVLVLATIESVALVSALVAASARWAGPRLRRSPLAGRLATLERAADRALDAVTERVRAVTSRLAPAAVPPALSTVASTDGLAAVSQPTPGEAPARTTPNTPVSASRSGRPWPMYAGRITLAALTLLALGFSLRAQRERGYLPFTLGFQWPQQTAHTQIADQIAALIPPDASVCAQSALAPHVSERRFIYQFPYRADQSDYIFLDVTGDRYPYIGDSPDYFAAVQQILKSGAFHVVAARDGYLLLARGAAPSANPADPNGLPASFYTFTELPPGQSIAHPLAVSFSPSLQLVGYDVTPSLQAHVGTAINVVSYWRVTGPLPGGLTPYLTAHLSDGTAYTFKSLVTQQWRPMSTWQPGATMIVGVSQLGIGGNEIGALRFGIQVRDAQGHPIVPTLQQAPDANGVPSLDPASGDVIFANVQVS